MPFRTASLALLLLASATAGASEEDVLVLGERVYRKACAPCHGTEGDGTGPQARWLDPLPRDFTLGTFKFRSTMSGAIPTDEDLRRTVDRGVPGTAMPSWMHLLSVRERDAVVATLKTFSDWFDDGVYPEDIVVTEEDLASPPPPTEEMLVAGREVYARMECAKCHGEDGRGNPDNPLEDDYGRPIVAFDFTTGTYKGGISPQDVYRSFTTGLDSTPMPSYADSLDETERWQLVYYCLALSRRATLRDWLLDPPLWNHRPQR
jgi:cytochrome c oxidase cbb3-type subunit 2